VSNEALIGTPDSPLGALPQSPLANSLEPARISSLVGPRSTLCASAAASTHADVPGLEHRTSKPTATYLDVRSPQPRLVTASTSTSTPAPGFAPILEFDSKKWMTWPFTPRRLIHQIGGFTLSNGPPETNVEAASGTRSSIEATPHTTVLTDLATTSFDDDDLEHMELDEHEPNIPEAHTVATTSLDDLEHMELDEHERNIPEAHMVATTSPDDDDLEYAELDEHDRVISENDLKLIKLLGERLCLPWRLGPHMSTTPTTTRTNKVNGANAGYLP